MHQMGRAEWATWATPATYADGVKANVLLTHFANLDLTHPNQFSDLLPAFCQQRVGFSYENSCH
jgi:hypothetical protein